MNVFFFVFSYFANFSDFLTFTCYKKTNNVTYNRCCQQFLASIYSRLIRHCVKFISIGLILREMLRERGEKGGRGGQIDTSRKYNLKKHFTLLHLFYIDNIGSRMECNNNKYNVLRS